MTLPISSLPQLPKRSNSAHKGTFGSALIIGGSKGMSGAATLAGLGALRGGAGLVYVATPKSIQPIVAAAEPAYLTIGLDEDEQGRISTTDASEIQDAVDRCTAVAIGPGLGQSESLMKLVASIYSELSQPLVIDADGLNILAKQPGVIAQHCGPRLLTPHPGEMARLLNSTTEEVQANRETLAKTFAKVHQCVVLLKGEATVISDGDQVAVNTTGNSGLATGGTGDVLTGLLVALLAQGIPVFQSAQLAAYVHGKAADLAAEHFGKQGLIASDLPPYLALALKELES